MSQKLIRSTDFIPLDIENQTDFQRGDQENQPLESEIQNIEINPRLVSGQETQRNPSRIGFFRSNIRDLLAGVSEITPGTSLLRKRWMVLLSVFLCSKVALETEETEKVTSKLFLAFYICLGYHIIENIFQYRHLKAANLQHQKMECLFEIIDKTILVVFVSSLHLYFSQVISEAFLLVTPLLFLLEIWMSQNLLVSESAGRDVEVLERCFYLVQSFLIVAKMNNIIDYNWKWTLVLLRLSLGLHAAFMVFTGLLLLAIVFSAIRNSDIETISMLKSKALSYTWHILYNGFINAIGLVISIEVFEKIDSGEDEKLQASLSWVKGLSAFLLVFSTILFPLLKKLSVGPLEDLLATWWTQVVLAKKKYTLVETEDDEKRKRAFFLMVSPTYFNLLPGISEYKVEGNENANQISISPHNKEENLCYICESSVSNAILAECGHGGVCCDCAIKSIERKNQCMECRKPVGGIYRIESHHPRNGREIIVQASEVIQVLEAKE